MPTTIAGLPHWELTFDAEGDLDAAQRQTLLTDLPATSVTDLFCFAHGWNNSVSGARALYRGWFSLLPPLVDPTDRGRIGTVGVFWPSMQWSDEPIPDFPGSGGAAGLGAPADEDAATEAALRRAYPHQRKEIGELFDLLASRPSDDAALQRFHELLMSLAPPPGSMPSEEGDVAEPLALPPKDLFSEYAAALDSVAATAGAGGAAGLGDAFGRLWDGAKEALRQLTYFQMKARAGVVGKEGLGPLVTSLVASRAGLRVHLVGHSFGARLASYAVAGSAADSVTSVTLLQGAFSHFAFAERLPPPLSGAGGLAGAQSRVGGPVVACFSRHDGALGTFYPLASMTSGDNAAALDIGGYTWGAIGFDGAQLVGATTTPVRSPGAAYTFPAGRLSNVDAARVVASGDTPAGAHSDIFHPELAWVALAAAGFGT